MARSVCIDYRDLNKASLKDKLSLPYMDVLVDNTAKDAMYSFMDELLRYNHIIVAKQDKEKTTFVMPWGNFCYKVMSFRLSVMYQKAMVILFHYMMHREVKVYVDDIFVNSKKKEDHEQVLKKLFERL